SRVDRPRAQVGAVLLGRLVPDESGRGRLRAREQLSARGGVDRARGLGQSAFAPLQSTIVLGRAPDQFARPGDGRADAGDWLGPTGNAGDRRRAGPARSAAGGGAERRHVRRAGWRHRAPPATLPRGVTYTA